MRWLVADRASRVARLASARLYLCTPLRESLAATCSFADAMLVGGVDPAATTAQGAASGVRSRKRWLPSARWFVAAVGC